MVPLPIQPKQVGATVKEQVWSVPRNDLSTARGLCALLILQVYLSATCPLPHPQQEPTVKLITKINDFIRLRGNRLWKKQELRVWSSDQDMKRHNPSLSGPKDEDHTRDTLLRGTS